MLYLCWLIDSLFYFHWVLIDFSPQFSSHLYLYVSLSDVILEYQEHRFIRLKQYAVLMHVHVFRRHRMLTDI
jgi:hypothetical protein